MSTEKYLSLLNKGHNNNNKPTERSKSNKSFAVSRGNGELWLLWKKNENKFNVSKVLFQTYSTESLWSEYRVTVENKGKLNTIH